MKSEQIEKFEILTCCSMFGLFLGISSANGIHIANIDLISEHGVMRHSLKLYHTVTVRILNQFLVHRKIRQIESLFTLLALATFHFAEIFNLLW